MTTIFSVKDSDPGIPDAEKNQIFQRFYRLDKNRRTPGHGLDLSIVKATVKFHGGTITPSNANPGMNFKIKFPKEDR